MRRLGTFWGFALTLALAFCGFVAPTGAHAQDQASTSELERNWSARLGIYILQSNAARSASGSAGVSVALERRVYAGKSYDITAGIGFNGIDQVYSVPLLINVTSSMHNLRYGGGIGYAFSKRINGRGVNGIAFDLLVGYQLTQTVNPLSIDLRYYFIGSTNNELDGYSLSLGIKF